MVIPPELDGEDAGPRFGSIGVVRAVILDLFGTLVSAPTDDERHAAVIALARRMRVAPGTVDAALTDSWHARHDGRLRDRSAVAEHLTELCSAQPSTTAAVASCLALLAPPRLGADSSVIAALSTLKAAGTRVGVLSDTTPDIAEAWDQCRLAPLVEAAVFSCQHGRVKPDPALYAAALDRLGVAASQAMYCGDGGGSELTGARNAGIRAVRVSRRGGHETLVFGEGAWSGMTIARIEGLPALLTREGAP